MKLPKISFVVSVHNPFYGKKYGMDNLYRMQLFINNIVTLCNTYSLSSELLIVEWNPKKPDMFQNQLHVPKNNMELTIKWITVPHTIHKTLPNAKKIPIFEFFAKNVGIRRARGNFILSTNPDVLFSHKLLAFLAKNTLADDFFYRTDRLDVRGYIPKSLPVTKQLKRIKSNIAVRHSMYGTVAPDKPGIYYFLKRRKRWKNLTQQYWSGDGLVANPDGLHRNASGDFFLMARSKWHQLHGYAEIFTHAHIDSIMCWQANTAGLHQIILPYALYHIDHDRSSRSRFPQTNWHIWYDTFQTHRQKNIPLIINNSSWGLKDKKLSTVTIV